MTIIDGINLGIGFMLAQVVLVLTLGLITLPVIYFYKKLTKTPKNK